MFIDSVLLFESKIVHSRVFNICLMKNNSVRCHIYDTILLLQRWFAFKYTYILHFFYVNFRTKTLPLELWLTTFKLHSFSHAQWDDGAVRVPALIWIHQREEVRLRRNNALCHHSCVNRASPKSATFSIRQLTAKNHRVSFNVFIILKPLY